MATIRKRTDTEGVATYQVQIRLKGFPPQAASFARLTDAKKWASATESAIREGRHFKTTEAKRRTLADLLDRYAKSAPSKIVADRAHIFRWWRDALGAYALADLSPAVLADCRDKLAEEGREPATVAKYLAALSHCFTQAVKEYGWLDSNPVLKVTKPTLPRGRTRFLSHDELARLLDACRESSCPALLPIVTLAVSTGARQGEILNLFWRKPADPPQGEAWGLVDMAAGRATVFDTKNGETRVLPLAGPAMDALREWAKVRTLGSDRVFPATSRGRVDRGIDIRTPWEVAVQRAGLADFRFHDLRHTCASHLAMNGASMPEIAAVLGHKTMAMVARYAHLSESHTAGVLERMNGRLFGGER